MIHYGDNGEFEEAYWDDLKLISTPQGWEPQWLSTSMVLSAFPNLHARGCFEFQISLTNTDSGARVALSADREMLRDIREAINVALGDA